MTESRSRPIQAQLMRMSTIIVVVSITLSLFGTLFISLRSERQALDSNLHNSATVLARVPIVAQALRGECSREELAEFLEDTTAQVSDIDLIVAADDSGNWYYAPDGVSPNPNRPSVSVEAALTYPPLGADRSAYAPVFDESGALLGYIIVGIYVRSMANLVTQTILRHVAIALMAAAVAWLLSQKLSQRIKSALLGYEPDDFAHLFHQRDDMLDALEEGILAVDREDNVIFLNAAAAQMLSLDPSAVVGRPLSSVYDQSTLARVMDTGIAEYNVSITSQRELDILSDRLPIRENGRIVGAVGIFRNRTEFTRLAEDLTGVRHMVEAMRAYTHEFMNKLHVILGLLQIGEPEKAQDYIMSTTHTQHEVVSRIMNQIREPSVAALLVGKTSRANELGIRLTLDRDSSLEAGSPWMPPDAYVTVLGNLIENAIEGLNQAPAGEKSISVSIREEERSLLLCVEDTGPGIPPQMRDKLFLPGVSSKGPARGTGLALVREVVDTYHGVIRIESETNVGTSCFVSFRREAQD